jgi:hypothetical protein
MLLAGLLPLGRNFEIVVLNFPEADVAEREVREILTGVVLEPSAP